MEPSCACRCKKPDVHGVGENCYCLSCGALVQREANTALHVISPAIAKSDFEYRPLRYHTSIRLVQLEPGRREDGIVVDIYHTLLYEETLSFEALSYTWGDNELSQEISIVKAKSRITRNCESALRDLRYPNRPRLLWIDALCINQQSNEEKNHQVPLMSRIYAEATRVIVYVGPDSDGAAKYLFPVLEERELGHGRRQIQAQVSSFLSKSWFSRVWVLQEVAVAREVEVIWGALALPWRYLSVAHMSSLELTTVDSSGNVPPALLLGKNDSTPLKDLVSLIYTSRRCQSSDARDKIFALIGLLRNVGQTVRIDYGRTFNEVLVEFTAKIISSYNNLDILLLADTETLEDKRETQAIIAEVAKSTSENSRSHATVMEAMPYLATAMTTFEAGRKIDFCTRKVAEALSRTLLRLEGLHDFFERFRLIQEVHSEVLSWNLPVLPRRNSGYVLVKYGAHGAYHFGIQVVQKPVLVYSVYENPANLRRDWESTRDSNIESMQLTSNMTNPQSFLENEIWKVMQEVQKADREVLNHYERAKLALEPMYIRKSIETRPKTILEDLRSRVMAGYKESLDQVRNNQQDDIKHHREQSARASASSRFSQTDAMNVENSGNIVAKFEMAAVAEGLQILYEILDSLRSTPDEALPSAYRKAQRAGVLHLTEALDKFENAVSVHSSIATETQIVNNAMHAEENLDGYREDQDNRDNGLSWVPSLEQDQSLKSFSFFRYTTDLYAQNVGHICSQHSKHIGLALKIRIIILDTVISRSPKGVPFVSSNDVNVDNFLAKYFKESCDFSTTKVKKFCRGRRRMLTDRSWIICSRQVQNSDIVCALYGAAVPFVLRPLGEDTYRLMGECFLDDYHEKLSGFKIWPFILTPEQFPWHTVCLE